MEKQLEKNGGEESNKEGGSADQKAQARPTYLVFKGARNNFSQVVFSDDEELERVCAAAGRRRDVSKRLAKLSIEPVEMKRSKRNEGKKKINYAESSVSEGGTIHSDESDYPEEVDCEEVSSVHVVPRIDTYHLGGTSGDGQRCCAKCREAIRALVQKNSDTFAVIDDLENRLSTEMIGIRRDVESFTRRMKGEVGFLLREMQHLNNALENINFKLNNPYYQPNEVWDEPEDEEPDFYGPEEDPLDPEDGWEWDIEDD
ncbi:hypothetical protein U9M48_040154 [Paspalum notatum var. saurae]|uniref:Uncharacterized protein n=1 Tax=Paspalum notatum var. saurae TaxID=547442 RepID=A0AAQ3XCU9_PASNO